MLLAGDSVAKLCLTLMTPWTVACQTPLSMGFPRQEYWSGLPFPSPGDLPDPGIETGSPWRFLNLEFLIFNLEIKFFKKIKIWRISTIIFSNLLSPHSPQLIQ